MRAHTMSLVPIWLFLFFQRNKINQWWSLKKLLVKCLNPHWDQSSGTYLYILKITVNSYMLFITNPSVVSIPFKLNREIDFYTKNRLATQCSAPFLFSFLFQFSKGSSSSPYFIKEQTQNVYFIVSFKRLLNDFFILFYSPLFDSIVKTTLNNIEKSLLQLGISLKY